MEFSPSQNLLAQIAQLKQVVARQNSELTQLREQLTALQQILDDAPYHFYLIGRDHTVKDCNRAQLKALGYESLEQIRGKTTYELFPAAQAEILMANNEAVINQNEVLWLEEETQTVDGKRIFLSVKKPYYNATGEIIGIVGNSFDITLYVDRLRYCQQFMSRLDHYVRNQLMGILSSTEAIMQVATPTTELYTATIQLGIKNITEFFDWLKNYFDFVTDAKPSVPSAGLITDSIQSAIEQMPQPTQFSFDYPAQLAYTPLMLDHLRLFTVVKTLLINARRFAEDESLQITAKLDYVTQMLMVEVTDHGEFAEQEYLFALFDQPLEAELLKKADFYLALCKDMIEQSGGKMGVNPRTDGNSGATFYLALPCAVAAVEENQVSSALETHPVAPHHAKQRLSLALIDDDKITHEAFTYLMQNLAKTSTFPTYHLQHARTLRTARKLLQKPLHFIFLDLHLATSSGFELVREIRQQVLHSNTVIIAITGDPAVKVTTCLAAGFNGLLVKPITVAKLTKLFQAFLT